LSAPRIKAAFDGRLAAMQALPGTFAAMARSPMAADPQPMSDDAVAGLEPGDADYFSHQHLADEDRLALPLDLTRLTKEPRRGRAVDYHPAVVHRPSMPASPPILDALARHDLSEWPEIAIIETTNPA
jgi:hypothetical protein